MPLTRSENMARIRSRDTSPERSLRSALHARGYRFRINRSVVGIRPDIVFPRHGVAVFVDGCFWHGCPGDYVAPQTRADFWSEKLTANVLRDRRQTRHLEDEGWRVLRLWEHEITRSADAAASLVADTLDSPDRVPGEHWQVVKVSRSDDGSEFRELIELRDALEPRMIRAG